jgi:hypothetical protein
MNPQNTEEINNKSKSHVLDLETLSSEYKNLLIEYRRAVADYVNHLKDETELPCGAFSADSTGITQQCYDEIWKKAGCGAGTEKPDASSSLAQGKTLSGLIDDAFAWATNPDYKHRMGCYGNPGNQYIIIGIGTDGRLYSRQGLSAPWKQINDNTSNCQSVCTMNDGTGLLGIGANNIVRKTSYDANWTASVKNSCCAISVAMGQDGTVIGVGTDNVLYSKASINDAWEKASSPGEQVYSIAIAPDGTIFAVGGGGGQLWSKQSYKNLPKQQWQSQGSCCVKAITIAPDGTLIGVGTDNQLYTKPNYKDLSPDWTGPHNSDNSSCCVIGVTTVANSNYNASTYNKSSSPQYNIDQQPLVSIKGATYWGTSSVGQNNSATLQECKASCAQTKGCTGATFNATAPQRQSCLLRGGDSSVTTGTADDYAIITKGKQLLNVVKTINQKLSEVNQKIQKITASQEATYNTQSQERHFKTADLETQFNQLNEDRDKIDGLSGKYQTLDQAQIQTGLTVTQRYYTFVLLALLAIIAIYLLFNFAVSSSLGSGSGLQSGGAMSIMNVGAPAYIILFGMILLIIGIRAKTC